MFKEEGSKLLELHLDRHGNDFPTRQGRLNGRTFHVPIHLTGGGASSPIILYLNEKRVYRRDCRWMQMRIVSGRNEGFFLCTGVVHGVMMKGHKMFIYTYSFYRQ